jgi:hypothetical protein
MQASEIIAPRLLHLNVAQIYDPVASAYQKPDGLTVVPSAEAKAWLTSLPVSCLWGVGPKTEARLHHTGLHTIGDVANGDLKLLSSTLCRWLRGPATTESSFTTSPDLMPCGGFV